jgi:hypothetical protein
LRDGEGVPELEGVEALADGDPLGLALCEDDSLALRVEELPGSGDPLGLGLAEPGALLTAPPGAEDAPASDDGDPVGELAEPLGAWEAEACGALLAALRVEDAPCSEDGDSADVRRDPAGLGEAVDSPVGEGSLMADVQTRHSYVVAFRSLMP